MFTRILDIVCWAKMFHMTSRVHVKTFDIEVYTVQCIEYHKISTKALTASLHLFEGFLGFHV